MPISEGKSVSLKYSIRDESGKLVDQSKDDQPWVFVHGAGQMLKGVERALLGHVAGDSLEIVVSPEDGYGERDISLTTYADPGQFADVDNLQEGLSLFADVEGEQVLATVKEVKEDKVLLDLNHPFAGKTLTFDVEILEVNDISIN